MDHESLFTATKWDILKILEKEPQSPIEIAKALHSSLANVSQQLRLLEMAGIVTSKRISNRDKDKPRVLYSIAGNLSYLIATSNNFVDKKILSLTQQNKIILRIWFLEDQQLRYALEKAFWSIEPHLEKISILSFAGIKDGKPIVEYKSEKKLPAAIITSGPYSTVILKPTNTPTGTILFERENE